MDHDQTSTVPAAALSARQIAGLRHASLGMAVALLVEYALGVGVNLYITVPSGYNSQGIGRAYVDALSKGPLALSIHAAVGTLLIGSAIVSLIRAIRARHRFVITTSTIALLAVTGAAVSGATFVDSARDSASLAMGLLTALALLCAALNLHQLGRPAS
jgi:hypothetical protein